jgi:predicted ATPase with chaperone activity
MLARRFTTILPAMTLAEALDTTRIHRVAGLTGDRTALVTTRPCRAPHHSIPDAGRIGGGHGPMPGEVSLAHHGGRGLDELPEFRPQVPEAFRQSLEEAHHDDCLSVDVRLVSHPAAPVCTPLEVKRGLFGPMRAPLASSDAARLRPRMDQRAGKILPLVIFRHP